MNKKIIGILVVTLLIATVLPATGSIEKNLYMTEKSEPLVFLDPGTSEEIQYSMVEADTEGNVDKSMVQSLDNLAPNPSFEEGDVLPTGWEHTDFGQGEEYHWDSDYAYTGEKSIGIQVPSKQNWYKWYTTDLIPVDTKNNYYVFSCYYKYTAVPDIAWQQILMINIELYDENEERMTGIGGVVQYLETLDWCFGAVYTESFPDDAAYARLGLWHRPQAGSSFDIQIRMDDVFFGTIEKNNPPETPNLNGPTSGEPGVEYTYTAVSTDPDGDMLYYIWDWGDGNESFSTRRDSGVIASESHIWESKGTYEVKVMARDFRYADSDSDWATLEVGIPKNKAINPFILFLERLMERFPILEQILQPIYDKLTVF